MPFSSILSLSSFSFAYKNPKSNRSTDIKISSNSFLCFRILEIDGEMERKDVLTFDLSKYKTRRRRKYLKGSGWDIWCALPPPTRREFLFYSLLLRPLPQMFFLSRRNSQELLWFKNVSFMALFMSFNHNFQLARKKIQGTFQENPQLCRIKNTLARFAFQWNFHPFKSFA